MPKSKSPPEDFKIYVDSSCVSGEPGENTSKKDNKILDKTIVHEEVGDNGEDMSQLEDPQPRGESSMDESHIDGDSLLNRELHKLREKSILEDEDSDSHYNSDLHHSAEAKEEKRKRVEARESQMKMIENEIKAAARKVVESIERDDYQRTAQGHKHSRMSAQTNGNEPEHNDSLLSRRTDDSDEQSGTDLTYDGRDGTELTFTSMKATVEDAGESDEEENDDSVLHHEIENHPVGVETERGDGGEEVEGGDDGSQHDADIDDDDVYSHGSVSRRSSINSSDEVHYNMPASIRTSWRNSRDLDLSKEAMQLVELNSPIVGEDAAGEAFSRLPSGASAGPRDSSCSPRKITRHPFRTPSNVRAIQMQSPAPSLFASPRSAKRQPSYPSVSRLGTPTSLSSKTRTPTRFKPKKEAPLVLLHVTVLPLQWPYTKAIVSSELSADLYSIREAYYLLQEKLSETILTRGILLPHPQDSYEVLEERLLEALELPVRPRAKILRCGHYIGPSLHSSDEDSADDQDSGFGSGKGRLDRTWCDICRRDVKYEKADPDDDDKRFNVKIFASNGLMRAGAWAAAWREMERVDVEIEPFVQPWMVEDMEDLIERLQEAEEKGERSDSFVDYDDDTYGESLGTEAQRLHEEAMAAKAAKAAMVREEEAEARRAEEDLTTARRKGKESQNPSGEIGANNKQADEFLLAKASEDEENRQRNEAEARRKKEENEAEAQRIESEKQRIRDEEEANRLREEAQRIEKELALEEEARRIHEAELAAEKAMAEESQHRLEEELASERALDEEAQRIHAQELAERQALEAEVEKLHQAEAAAQKAKEASEAKSKSEKAEEAEKRRLQQQNDKAIEEARLKEIYNRAAQRKTTTGDESLSELLIKAFHVAIRDRKNIAIAVLSLVVLVLALRPGSSPTPDIIIQSHRYETPDSRFRESTMQMQMPVMEIESPSVKEVVIQTTAKPVVMETVPQLQAVESRLKIEVKVPRAVDEEVAGSGSLVEEKVVPESRELHAEVQMSPAPEIELLAPVEPEKDVPSLSLDDTTSTELINEGESAIIYNPEPENIDRNSEL
ncbi:pathway-specific nitrogen regulator protein [Rutstroemia sp. NJR-2017a BVV2]|nr:pathway-specific nitrogen regulator protein [Rutstroemia sp. NJR-2017a BVV2]